MTQVHAAEPAVMVGWQRIHSGVGMKWIFVLLTVAVMMRPYAARGAAQENQILAKQAAEVLAKHCHRCHGDKGTVEGGLHYLFDTGKLIARKQIVPGDPAKSRLLQRVVAKEMPPATEKGRPSPADEAILRQWIQAGAPALRAVEKRTLATHRSTAEVIWSDLKAVPADDQRFMRYFTLGPLYNAGDSQDELEVYRQALAKLVNSLSWGPEVVLPVAVDPARTLFRVDMRDYKWSKRTWGIISGNHPYTVDADTDADRKCREAMETDRYYLRADWFAGHATMPESYQSILDLPADGADLRKLLGVEADKGRPTGKVHRAGFLGSRVTPFARMIERHESHFGAFWITYNFNDTKRLFDQPLGGPQASFLTETQQVIFHLPNGLIGYAVWDLGQKMQPTAKDLQDVRRKDASVRAPLSCMSCHTQGVHGKQDEVVAYAQKKKNFTSGAMAMLRQNYPSPAFLAAKVRDDTKRFNEALAKIEAAPAPVGKGIQRTAEPIVALVLRHEESLDPAQLAAELGIAVEQLKAKSPAFVKILAASKASAIRRQIFVDAFSQLAEDAGLGKVPVRVGLGSRPVAFAEMLLPARGLPVEPAVVRKADPPITAPGQVTLAENKLQSLTVRDHLICRFTGYRGVLQPLAMSGTERLLASESRLGVVTLYNPVTAEKRVDLEGHKAPVTAIEFSPDGKLVATASQDGTVMIWRASSGLLLSTLPHASSVTAIRFSPDGKRLASVSDQISLWAVPAGSRIETKFAKLAWSAVNSLAFSPDMKTLIAAGKSVKIVDLNTGKERPSPKASGIAFAVSPDGQWLAAASSHQIVLWDMVKMESKAVLRGHREPINALAFSPDSKLLVSGAGQGTVITSRSGEVKVWEIDNESHWKDVEGTTRAVISVAIGADGKLAACADHDGVIRVFSLDSKSPTIASTAPRSPFEGHLGRIRCLVQSRDERFIVTGGNDGTVRLWDAKSGAELKCLIGHETEVRAVALSLDGKNAYSAGADAKFIRWDLVKGVVEKRFDLPKGTGTVAFSATGKYLAVGTSAGQVEQIHTGHGKTLRKLDGYSAIVDAVFSDDDNLLAVTDLQRNVQIWDLTTNKVRSLQSKPGGAGNFYALAFSPNGELLAASSGVGRAAKCWDLKTNEEIQSAGPFSGNVHDVVFAKDNRSLFVSTGMSGFESKTKRLFSRQCAVTQVDAETGQVVQYWDQFSAVPTRILRTADGRQLIVVVGDTLMRLPAENGKTGSAVP